MNEESPPESRPYEKWLMFFLLIERMLSLRPRLVRIGLIDLLIDITRFNPDSHASTTISEPYAKILRLFKSGFSSYETL
jgi:hypothetical protein